MTQSADTGITPTPKTTVPLHGAKRWAYLTRQKTIRVASTGEDGSIYLTPLWYVVVDKKIFLSINAGARHATNAEAGRPLAALVDDGDEFATVSGVRITGRMVHVDDAPLAARLGDLLFEKYFGTGHPYAEAYLEMQDAAVSKFYELVPDRMVGWDAREIAIPPVPESRRLPEFVKDRTLR